MNVGCHASHCCKIHGCKYGDPNCPVVSGEVEQEYLCEYCYNDLEDESYLKQRLEDVESVKELRRRLENKK